MALARLLLVVSLLLLIINSFQVEGQKIAVARFNAQGIRGYIKFIEVDTGVQIQANLQGLRGSHKWHVHTLPIDQTADPSVQCLSNRAGPHYDPFSRKINNPNYGTECTTQRPEMCEVGDLAGKFGPLMPNMVFDQVDTTGNLTLSDRYSIIGRSIVIHNDVDNTNFECATIRSITESQGTEVSLLQASFTKPIGGTIYLRQVYGEDVQMWGKVYWTNDYPDTMNHNWHIHMSAPGEEYREGVCDTAGNIGGHYRPFGNGPPSRTNYSTICTPYLTSGCEVGDLTGKHNTISIAASPSPYMYGSFFFTDNFLNLTGSNYVLNRSIAIHQANRGGPVIACAPLVRSENIIITQYKLGEVVISQGSPFEDTVIASTNSRTMTTLQKFSFSPSVQCGTDNVFAPYEPVDIPEPGVSTPDKYHLGKLQARYDNIRGSETQRVFDLPVYGANVSITGLSLRTQNSGGTYCSALIPMLRGSGTIVAKITFSRVVRGAIYFVQEDFGYGQLGNTHIIVDIYYADSSRTITTGHNWHVHMNPSVDGSDCTGVIGGHYNPFNVSLGIGTNSDYSSDCSPSNQLRCESGDMSGKHGKFTLQSDGANRPGFTFVDSNVQLTGSFSVIGRSIGLHDGSPFIDCGTIKRVYVSAAPVTVTTYQSTMLRSALTTTLAQSAGATVDPTDILVLNQRDYTNAGVGCVEISIRVLGTSQTEADSNAQMVDRAGDALTCSGGSSGSASISQVTLILPLLMALLYFMMTMEK